MEGALAALAGEAGPASAKALGAAVHELALGCLALKEVRILPARHAFQSARRSKATAPTCRGYA